MFHGCYYPNAGSTNKLIALEEECLLRTNRCFWKDPDDVNSHITTRSLTKSKLDVSWRVINNYYKGKQKDNPFYQNVYFFITNYNMFQILMFSFPFSLVVGIFHEKILKNDLK